MNEQREVDLYSFSQRVKHHKRKFRRFITRLEKRPPKGLPALANRLEKEVWHELDCLTCAGCCKTMTPTFTEKDIKRISAHLGESPQQFKETRLRREKGGDRDWLNKKDPCPFLDLTTNKCNIYEVRPSDCSGFPHLQKNMKNYGHVHKQNIECCPASFKMIEKMMLHLNHPVGNKHL